jgi:hypothetical protein
MKREKAEKKIRKYLYDLHVTLWSDFDLHRPDSFEKAVEWFLDQVVRAGLVSDKDPQEEARPPRCKDKKCEYKELRHYHPESTRVGEIPNLNPLGIEDFPPVESVPDLPVPFVTYKHAECICEGGEDQHSEYMILNPDCPIHGPHAFPWRKSR